MFVDRVRVLVSDERTQNMFIVFSTLSLPLSTILEILLQAQRVTSCPMVNVVRALEGLTNVRRGSLFSHEIQNVLCSFGIFVSLATKNENSTSHILG